MLDMITNKLYFFKKKKNINCQVILITWTVRKK